MIIKGKATVYCVIYNNGLIHIEVKRREPGVMVCTVTPAFRRLRKDDLQFEVNLRYMASLMSVRAIL